MNTPEMQLTRERAIELCKELWQWCAKTGKHKSEWPEWEKIRAEFPDLNWGARCPFCTFKWQFTKTLERCPHCPLVEEFGKGCFSTPYRDWDRAKTKEDRRKFAREFLALLEQL